MKKRKVSNVIKQSFRKLKYLDKTQLNYFIVMSFLLGFCLFTGVTYSYFTFSKHLNAATITIAKLKYNLSSPTSGYASGNVTVPAGEKIAVDLNLASLNKINTKYALKYSTADSGIKVYYSESYKNNMTGEIGPQGSNITMRVIIVNEGTTSGSVNLTISGGYLQNTLETNITEGYFEEDIVIRTVLLEDSLTNGIIGDSFPPQDGEYTYFKTECSGDAAPTWNNATWELELGEISGRVACDVYFKKMSNDIEVYFALEKNDGTTEYTTSVPNDGTYTFDRATCNTDATATWDTENWKMNISGIQRKTICTGYFKERGYEPEAIAFNSLRWDDSNAGGGITSFKPKYEINFGYGPQSPVTLDVTITLDTSNTDWEYSGTTTVTKRITLNEENEYTADVSTEFSAITLKEELAQRIGTYTYQLPICTITISSPSDSTQTRVEKIEGTFVHTVSSPMPTP